VSGDLSFDLHVLTSRLDKAADRILEHAVGLSYRRFLALLLVGELGTPTQRALAAALGVTEPSASRMTGVLADAGYLDASNAPRGGNRRELTLTPAGKEVVEASRELLERRFADLVTRSGVPYASYSRHTRALIAALADNDGRVQ
jgi:DNA-binding MarR family transcriptional regulator